MRSWLSYFALQEVLRRSEVANLCLHGLDLERVAIMGRMVSHSPGFRQKLPAMTPESRESIMCKWACIGFGEQTAGGHPKGFLTASPCSPGIERARMCLQCEHFCQMLSQCPQSGFLHFVGRSAAVCDPNPLRPFAQCR